MPRVSNATKELAEAHRKTMMSCPNFMIWQRRFLRHNGRTDEYEKAFNYLHNNVDESVSDEQETD